MLFFVKSKSANFKLNAEEKETLTDAVSFLVALRVLPNLDFNQEARGSFYMPLSKQPTLNTEYKHK